MLILVSVITVWVAFQDKKGGNRNALNNRFAIQDASMVEKVVMTGPDFRNELIKKGNQWTINGQYKADPDLTKIMLVVLNRVKARRAVAKANSGEIREQLEQSGVMVQAFGKGQLLSSFISGGNPNQTQTYYELPDQDTPFIVSIPGYESYIAGFFTMKENEWRDRTIFHSNWQATALLAFTRFSTTNMIFVKSGSALY